MKIHRRSHFCCFCRECRQILYSLTDLPGQEPQEFGTTLLQYLLESSFYFLNFLNFFFFFWNFQTWRRPLYCNLAKLWIGTTCEGDREDALLWVVIVNRHQLSATKLAFNVKPQQHHGNRTANLAREDLDVPALSLLCFPRCAGTSVL